MTPKRITLPNSPDNFLLQEMCRCLAEGQSTTISFGGRSMLPMLNGESDTVTLAPLAANEDCAVGNIYLFFYNNHYIIHRLLRIDDDLYFFRGDNCRLYEQVQRKAILGRLVQVQHADGSIESTDSEAWMRRSRRVVRRRNVINWFATAFGQQNRWWESAIYFAFLATLMWAPLNGIGIPLDNFVFGLRLDHLLHASIYLLCPYFLLDMLNKRRIPILLVAWAIGIVTESVQYLLPWRGFDINDLIANFIGCLLGWLILLPHFLPRQKNSVKNN